MSYIVGLVVGVITALIIHKYVDLSKYENKKLYIIVGFIGMALVSSLVLNNLISKDTINDETSIKEDSVIKDDESNLEVDKQTEVNEDDSSEAEGSQVDDSNSVEEAESEEDSKNKESTNKTSERKPQESKPVSKPNKVQISESKPQANASKPKETSKPQAKPSAPQAKPSTPQSKPNKPQAKPSSPQKPAEKPKPESKPQPKPTDKVEYKTRQERKEVYYDIKVEGTDSLFVGEQKVKTQGQNGYIITEYKDKYVNGVKVDTTSKVIDKKDKVDEVILAGTKIKVYIDDAQSRAVIHAVNAHRKANGSPQLQWDEALYSAAKVRAEEILEKFDHYRPSGKDFSSAMDEAGVVYWAAGENIAAGQRNVEEVMIAWKNSPGHNRNMLDKGYTHMAAAKLETSYGGYWVQLFIGK